MRAFVRVISNHSEKCAFVYFDYLKQLCFHYASVRPEKHDCLDWGSGNAHNFHTCICRSTLDCLTNVQIVTWHKCFCTHLFSLTLQKKRVMHSKITYVVVCIKIYIISCKLGICLIFCNIKIRIHYIEISALWSHLIYTLAKHLDFFSFWACANFIPNSEVLWDQIVSFKFAYLALKQIGLFAL